MYKTSFKRLRQLNWSTYMRKNCPRIHDGEKGKRLDKMLQDQVWY